MSVGVSHQQPTPTTTTTTTDHRHRHHRQQQLLLRRRRRRCRDFGNFTTNRFHWPVVVAGRRRWSSSLVVVAGRWSSVLVHGFVAALKMSTPTVGSLVRYVCLLLVRLLDRVHIYFMVVLGYFPYDCVCDFLTLHTGKCRCVVLSVRSFIGLSLCIFFLAERGVENEKETQDDNDEDNHTFKRQRRRRQRQRQRQRRRRQRRRQQQHFDDGNDENSLI